MITMYNTTITMQHLTKEDYDKLIDFIEENHYDYYEDDFEEFILDDRSESEKYQDWLCEQADIEHDKEMIGE